MSIRLRLACAALPALALAARGHEQLARLPEGDDLAYLLLRLDLPANVLEVDAPVGVPGLEALADTLRECSLRECKRRGVTTWVDA